MLKWLGSGKENQDQEVYFSAPLEMTIVLCHVELVEALREKNVGILHRACRRNSREVASRTSATRVYPERS